MAMGERGAASMGTYKDSNCNKTVLPMEVESILWDMDGVLAEVRLSYRAAIIETVRHLGGSVTHVSTVLFKAPVGSP